jgi:hypothetical protein
MALRMAGVSAGSWENADKASRKKAGTSVNFFIVLI